MFLSQIVWLEFDHMNKHYEGEAIPVLAASSNTMKPAFDIYFDNEYSGSIVQQNNSWAISNFFEEDVAKIVSRKLYSFLNRE